MIQKKPLKRRVEPRDHHYLFAHFVVRQACEEDPVQFFRVMTSPMQFRYLSWLWDLTAERAGRPVAEVNPKELRIASIKIKGRPAIVFSMPPAEAAAEAHFVGVVLTGDPERDKSQPGFRYLTLEYAEAPDGVNGTALCEWVQDRHWNFGDGPPATVQAFADSIAQKI